VDLVHTRWEHQDQAGAVSEPNRKYISLQSHGDQWPQDEELDVLAGDASTVLIRRRPPNRKFKRDRNHEHQAEPASWLPRNEANLGALSLRVDLES